MNPERRFRRPLLPLVLAYLSGLLLAAFLPLPLFLPLILFIVTLLLAISLIWLHRLLGATLVSYLLFASLGAAAFIGMKGFLPPSHLSRLPEKLLETPLTLEGVVVAPPERVHQEEGEGERLRVVLRVEKIYINGIEREVRGKARVSFLQWREAYQYGDRLHGTFQLRHPRGFLNPGGFSYQRFLESQGIFLDGFSKDDTNVTKLGSGGGNPILAKIYQLRSRMLRTIEAALPGQRGALVKAILLGDRSSLTKEVEEAFLRSGTYHLLAISGLNVGLLAGSLFFLLKLLRAPPRLSAFLSLVLVTSYAALAGGSPSVVRAAVMADTYLLALLIEREADLLNTLALSCFLLLLWNPLFLFDVGFQLTFVATFAIVMAVGRVKLERVPSLWKPLFTSLLVSSAAFFGTLPILARAFHRAAPIGILANLLAVPLSGLLTPLGMLFALLLLLFPHGLGPLSLLVGVLADLLIGSARLFATFPLATLTLYPPDLLMIALYALCFLSLFFGRSWARWLVPSSTLVLLLMILLKLFPLFERDLLKVSFLDVGQGDAILLELPWRRTILVDGGGLSLSYGDFDIGEKVVAPYLRHRWIRKLDVVVLSHPHSDHLDGLRAVFQEFPVGELWEAGYPSSSPVHLFIGEFARLRGIPHRIIEAGFVFPAFGPVTLSVLHPAQPFLQGSPRGSFSDTNSNSIVLMVQYGQVRILLAGDIEEEAEGMLVRKGADLRADFLKVPHHGSRTSSSLEFLAAVKPRVAVVSVGVRNRFHHPHPETLARYQEARVKLYRTDRDGAVIFTTNGKTFKVASFQQQ